MTKPTQNGYSTSAPSATNRAAECMNIGKLRDQTFSYGMCACVHASL